MFRLDAPSSPELKLIIRDQYEQPFELLTMTDMQKTKLAILCQKRTYISTLEEDSANWSAWKSHMAVGNQDICCVGLKLHKELLYNYGFVIALTDDQNHVRLLKPAI